MNVDESINTHLNIYTLSAEIGDAFLSAWNRVDDISVYSFTNRSAVK
jgi:hypothetical protein